MSLLTKSRNDCQSSSLINLETFPPPVSETDQKFVEKLSENVGKIKLSRRYLSGPINTSEEELKKREGKILVNSGQRTKFLERKRYLQKNIKLSCKVKRSSG